MKTLALFLSYMSASLRRRNVRALLVLLAVWVGLVALYSTVFHVLMDREDQLHSWLTSVYWTLVTMTTLGFGDITFSSDLGRVFSAFVLLSEILFLLVLLPFTFIQFVFAPWMAMREAARAPRALPGDATGHLVLTDCGPIEDALARRADRAGVPYVIIVGSLDEALSLHDRGYSIMLGDLDDPASYPRRPGRARGARGGDAHRCRQHEHHVHRPGDLAHRAGGRHRLLGGVDRRPRTGRRRRRATARRHARSGDGPTDPRPRRQKPRDRRVRRPADR